MGNDVQNLNKEREEIRARLEQLGKAIFFGGPDGRYEFDDSGFKAAQENQHQIEMDRARLASIDAELNKHRGPGKK